MKQKKNEKNKSALHRIIKFKGKTIEDNKWVFGQLTYNQKDDKALIWVENKQGTFDIFPVYTKSVCQYIGKIGETEFYENDICEHRYGTDAIIYKGHLQGYGFEYQPVNIDYQDWSNHEWFENEFSFKVVGNLFDTPEFEFKKEEA